MDSRISTEQPDIASRSEFVVDEYEDEPIDLNIRNVVSSFSSGCHIDLRKLALASCHVVYERNKGVVMKQLKNPRCQARISSTGKIAITGCHSEKDAKIACRRVARILQKIFGTKAKFANFRIINIMATCRLPFPIHIEAMAREYPKEASYEPELNVGLIWRNVQPKATLRIYTTGSVTVTGATSEENVLEAMESMYHIFTNFRVSNRPEQPIAIR